MPHWAGCCQGFEHMDVCWGNPAIPVDPVHAHCRKIKSLPWFAWWGGCPCFGHGFTVLESKAPPGLQFNNLFSDVYSTVYLKYPIIKQCPNSIIYTSGSRSTTSGSWQANTCHLMPRWAKWRPGCSCRFEPSTHQSSVSAGSMGSEWLMTHDPKKIWKQNQTVNIWNIRLMIVMNQHLLNHKCWSMETNIHPDREIKRSRVTRCWKAVSEHLTHHSPFQRQPQCNGHSRAFNVLDSARLMASKLLEIVMDKNLPDRKA